jgi:hypothetical protein
MKYLLVLSTHHYWPPERTSNRSVQGFNTLSPLSDNPWAMREFGVMSPEGRRIMIGQWIGEQQ